MELSFDRFMKGKIMATLIAHIMAMLNSGIPAEVRFAQHFIDTHLWLFN
jgi:hypothetical protein